MKYFASVLSRMMVCDLSANQSFNDFAERGRDIYNLIAGRIEFRIDIFFRPDAAGFDRDFLHPLDLFGEVDSETVDFVPVDFNWTQSFHPFESQINQMPYRFIGLDIENFKIIPLVFMARSEEV